MTTIQAGVVLYKETITSSPTCIAMLEALRSQAAVRERVELLLASRRLLAAALSPGPDSAVTR